MSKPNNVIGSSSKPVKIKWRTKVKLNGLLYGGEAKQNYNDNYDRIFGGTKNVSRQKENG